MNRPANLTLLVATMTAALMVAGCGTSGPLDATGLRRVVGTDLIGARGATASDQRKIDRTVVGLCAGSVWTESECASHGEWGRNGE